jgi:predicted TIM-barrel fold metal-dependent hydrolase
VNLIREDWLKLTNESVIDPEIPICDPHHHLWYEDNNSYTVEQFQQDISGGHRVIQSVFIESRKMLRKDVSQEMQPVGETEFVQNLITRNTSNFSSVNNIPAGIVGFADLTIGHAIEPVLEAHIAAGKGYFRGIRFTSTWNASPEIRSNSAPGILADSKFREGFSCLRKYGLSFDAWLYHPQLMELVDLAKAFPDILIILDHIGGPLNIGPFAKKRGEVIQQWKRGICALGTCENVFVKLGGLGMDIGGFGWQKLDKPPDSIQLAEAFVPYFLWCIEHFGVNRCMFESNFPVDKRSYSYTALWNAFKLVSKNFSHDERCALFYNTAIKAYRIPAINDTKD